MTTETKTPDVKSSFKRSAPQRSVIGPNRFVQKLKEAKGIEIEPDPELVEAATEAEAEFQARVAKAEAREHPVLSLEGREALRLRTTAAIIELRRIVGEAEGLDFPTPAKMLSSGAYSLCVDIDSIAMRMGELIEKAPVE